MLEFMTVIYIARHGQDEDNVRGILNGHRNLPLTDLGRQQAQQLARRIRDRELVFDVVYASPLDRALETAAIVATELGLAEPIVHDDLIERNFGIMTGKPVTDIEEMCTPDIIKAEKVTFFCVLTALRRFLIFISAIRILSGRCVINGFGYGIMCIQLVANFKKEGQNNKA